MRKCGCCQDTTSDSEKELGGCSEPRHLSALCSTSSSSSSLLQTESNEALPAADSSTVSPPTSDSHQVSARSTASRSNKLLLQLLAGHDVNDESSSGETTTCQR